MRPTPRACRSRVESPSRRPSSFEATSRQGYTQWSVLVARVMRVVVPSHDPNIIFSLANNLISVIVFY
jgi:hypothetical protein